MTFKDYIYDQPSAQMLSASVDGKKHIAPLLENLQSGKGRGNEWTHNSLPLELWELCRRGRRVIVRTRGPGGYQGKKT